MQNTEKGAVTGHSRSSAMSPFHAAHTTSHSTLIETMNLLNLHKEGPRLNFAEMFGTRKLESLGYCYANGKHWCSGCGVSPDPAGGLQRSPDS